MPRGGRRHELIRGELRSVSPAGNQHGRIAMRLGWRVAQFVEENELGLTFTAETGFLIEEDPDTVRAPDFAFVSQARSTAVGEVAGFWPGAPDLAVEVVSPNDSFSDVEAKSLQWLNSGTHTVWVIDPQQRHVTVYRGPDDIQIRDAGEILDSLELLPGWSVLIGDLFKS